MSLLISGVFSTSLFVLLLTSGCSNGGNTDNVNRDSAAIGVASRVDGDSTVPPESMDSTVSLAPAPQELQDATIPLRSPDGRPARYGLESGRVEGRYTGDARGTRVVTFGEWGLRERKEDNIAPWPETKSVAINNVIYITTEESQAYADRRTRQGFTRKINPLQAYLASPVSKTVSFGAWIADNENAQRLPDTTISGYPTSVYVRELNGIRSTVWVWRGITIREHVEVPKHGVDYWMEPVEITPNVDVSDATFEFPDGFNVVPYVPAEGTKP